MSRYDLVINGAAYRVEIGQISDARASVRVNGVAYDVEIPSGSASPSLQPAVAPAPAEPQRAAAPAAAQLAPKCAVSSPAPPAGGEVVLSPMPGHVLSVAVKPGDAVDVGDTVVVMEAMKMENEIRAHVAGTVIEVKVAKGQDVAVCEVLAVIGP